MRLHQLAAQSGDGLHPKLVKLLDRELNQEIQDVIPLQAPIARTPPGEQSVSSEELKALGIPMLRRCKPLADGSQMVEADKVARRSEPKGG